MLKILRYLLSSASLLAAIIFSIYSAFVSPLDLYQYMILILLILIASTFLLNAESEKVTNKKLNKAIEKIISAIPPSSIYVHNDVDVSTVKALQNIEADVTQIDMVAIDVGTRTPQRKRSGKINNIVDTFIKSPNINFRYVIKLNQDNFVRNIMRIKKHGGADKKNFISYLQFDEDIPLVSFIIVNSKVVLTRSPYRPGDRGNYLAIENETLVQYFQDWFKMLIDSSTSMSSNESIKKAYQHLVAENQISEENIKVLQTIDKELFS